MLGSGSRHRSKIRVGTHGGIFSSGWEGKSSSSGNVAHRCCWMTRLGWIAMGSWEVGQPSTFLSWLSSFMNPLCNTSLPTAVTSDHMASNLAESPQCTRCRALQPARGTEGDGERQWGPKWRGRCCAKVRLNRAPQVDEETRDYGCDGWTKLNLEVICFLSLTFDVG